MPISSKFARLRVILLATLALFAVPAAEGLAAFPLAAVAIRNSESSLNPRALDAPSGESMRPDATLQVPWNGTYWQSMPNFTWAACDVSRNTRRAIDIAIGQWSYAGNQGIPIRLSEVECSNGKTSAQIRIFEASG